jgi:hypothetical protein
MNQNSSRPGVTVQAKVGKPYHSKPRRITVTEFHVSFADWGKLQEIVLREAARGLGVGKGGVVLRLGRPDGDEGAMVPGTISLVRRGARARKVAV